MTPAIRTRAAWIYEATIQLGVAALHFLIVRLALKNGKMRWARSWQPIIDKKLRRRVVTLLSEPVTGDFDPATALEDALIEVWEKMEPIRAEVEVRFAEVCPIKRGLTVRDSGLFLEWVREAVGAVLEDPRGGLEDPREGLEVAGVRAGLEEVHHEGTQLPRVR
jgi:hypothetical protein